MLKRLKFFLGMFWGVTAMLVAPFFGLYGLLYMGVPMVAMVVYWLITGKDAMRTFMG
jgi:hypothetical protein